VLAQTGQVHEQLDAGYFCALGSKASAARSNSTPTRKKPNVRRPRRRSTTGGQVTDAEHGIAESDRVSRPDGLDEPAFDDRERHLDPRVLQLWRITVPVGLLLLLVPLVPLSLALLGKRGLPLVGVGLVVVAVLAVWYPGARYARWRWRLTPLALELRYGVVIHRHTAVPYFRIQQIDITRGVLERWLDLATLQVTTASASGSASLPGIAAGEAPKVRAEMLARASATVGAHHDGISDAV
jgi:uncharacterized protein